MTEGYEVLARYSVCEHLILKRHAIYYVVKNEGTKNVYVAIFTGTRARTRAQECFNRLCVKP